MAQRWTIRSEAAATFAPPGLFTKDAETIARVLATEEGEPEGPRLRRSARSSSCSTAPAATSRRAAAASSSARSGSSRSGGRGGSAGAPRRSRRPRRREPQKASRTAASRGASRGRSRRRWARRACSPRRRCAPARTALDRGGGRRAPPQYGLEVDHLRGAVVEAYAERIETDVLESADPVDPVLHCASQRRGAIWRAGRPMCKRCQSSISSV